MTSIELLFVTLRVTVTYALLYWSCQLAFGKHDYLLAILPLVGAGALILRDEGDL